MAKKKISLIVLNYNGKQHLKEYFNSVFQQTLIPDEVIMMDNASADGSQEFVEKHFPRVKVIKNEFNAGTAEGSNIAFKYTHGDYVIFQSNDIRLDKNCVRVLVETMNKEPRAGIVTSVLLRYDKDKKTGENLIDNAGGKADFCGFGMQEYWGQRIEDIPTQKEIFFSYGGSFIVRHRTYKRVGGFDNRYFTLSDDIDLSWRVRLLGYNIIYNKRSVVYHKVSATLGGPLFGKPLKRFWSERNIMRTLLKNYDLVSLLARFPIYMTLLAAEMGYFLLRGHVALWLTDLRVILWNFVFLPETLKMRWEIQHHRAKKNNINQLLIKQSLKLRFFNDFKTGL